MLRCGPLTRSVPRVGPTEVDPPPSDPLVRGLPRGKDTDQGFVVGAGGPERMGGWGVRGGPRAVRLSDGAGSQVVVETRRLELLTLSLQRRCSAN